VQWEEHPDAGWVAALTGTSEARATAALSEAAGERSVFRAIERAHRAEGRSSYIEIDAPFELYAIARLLRPQHIVEVGVSSGVSSAYLLAACERNRKGTLHSVDLPKAPGRPHGRTRAPTASWSIPPGRGSGWAVPFGLRARWDLRLGDKGVVVPLLAEELPRIDLVVYDVPHREADLDREFRRLDPRLVPGGAAIADHGPSGDCCAPLAQWARRRGSHAQRCQDLGLYGFRAAAPPRSGGSPARAAR